MRIYLAGWQAADYGRELRLITAGAVPYRCVSFAYVAKVSGFPFFAKGPAASYQACLDHGVGIMMDSGVYSYRAYKARLLLRNKPLADLPTEEVFTAAYIDFCKAQGSRWDFCVTLDMDLDVARNYARHVALEAQGLRTVPAIHSGGTGVLDYLRRYKDRGYDYVGVSSPAGTRRQRRQYLDALFDVGAKHSIRFHGLGLTTPWIMLEYPWFSVDSSAWSRSASYGRLIYFDEVTERLTDMHVSDQEQSKRLSSRRITNPVTLRLLREHVETEGYKWREIQTDFVARHLYNARTMQKLAAYAAKKHSSSGGQWVAIL